MSAAVTADATIDVRLAVGALVPRVARTRVARAWRRHVVARPVAAAVLAGAAVDIDAVPAVARVPGVARARVRTVVVVARGLVVARVAGRRALVHVVLADGAVPARHARAREPGAGRSDVGARSVGAAVLAGAPVDVRLAVRALVARAASANVARSWCGDVTARLGL